VNCPECGGVDTIVMRKMVGQLYKFCDVSECSWEYSTSRNDDYSWVTDEMFDDCLNRIVSGLDGDALFAIPGAYELLSEALNNDVLSALEEKRDSGGEEE